MIIWRVHHRKLYNKTASLQIRNIHKFWKTHQWKCQHDLTSNEISTSNKYNIILKGGNNRGAFNHVIKQNGRTKLCIGIKLWNINVISFMHSNACKYTVKQIHQPSSIISPSNHNYFSTLNNTLWGFGACVRSPYTYISHFVFATQNLKIRSQIVAIYSHLVVKITAIPIKCQTER